MATHTETIALTPSEFISTDYSYASVVSGYPTTNPIGKSETSTTMSRFNLKTGSSATSWVYYKFDTSTIPQDAVINSVSCKAKVYINQTNSSRINTRQVQLFSGTTAKGSASTMSTSTNALTLNVGTWTRAELNDCRIRLYAKRGTSNTTTTYYMGLYGATVTISYTWQTVDYTITTNVTNGTIAPNNPTVESGQTQVFKIMGTVGTEPLESLKLDGTNVLSQVVRKEATNDPSFDVSKVSGATYEFVSNGIYYESNNKGKASSTALSRIGFNFSVECTVDVYVINYAESTYDYGLLSNIDTTLSTSASADSSGVFWNGKNNNSASEQKVTYIIPSGEHFITVKYFKDNYTDSNNDSLKFRIEITPNEVIPSGGFYYEYTLTNVNSNHTLVAIFGNAPEPTEIFYIKDNGSWKQVTAIYKKENGVWVIQDTLEGVFNSNTNYIKYN